MFFIDELLTDFDLVLRFYAEDNLNAKITKTQGQKVFLGAAPVNKDSLNFGYSNAFSSNIGIGLDTLVDTGASLLNSVNGFLRGFGQFSDALFKILEETRIINSNNNPIRQFVNNIVSGNPLADKALVSPSSYRRMFAGSEVRPPFSSITLFYLSGMTMLSDEDGKTTECNVKQCLHKLLTYTIGNFEKVSAGNSDIMGIQSSPNGFSWSPGLSDDSKGTFSISFGSANATKEIKSLLVSSVDIIVSPILTDTDDYYYALASIGLDSARKYTRDDMVTWMGLNDIPSVPTSQSTLDFLTSASESVTGITNYLDSGEELLKVVDDSLTAIGTDWADNYEFLLNPLNLGNISLKL